jgi:Flp pilus assembly protein TadD
MTGRWDRLEVRRALRYAYATMRPALVLLLLLAQLDSSGCASYRGARLYHAGTLSLEKGDTRLAISQLEEAASLVPQASEIENHLGLAYLEDGRRPDALRAFERAVELDCSNAAARENLAATSAGVNSVSQAQERSAELRAGKGPNGVSDER